MSAIRFEQVSKQFTLRQERPRSFQEAFLKLLRREPTPRKEKYWALRDVSFAIEQGEMVGIVGLNGAGKSTALKLMSRIIEPTRGQVLINGQVGALLELGAGFHPDLTGRENIYLNGSILGFDKAKMDRIFDDIVEFSELERFINVQVKHYSSGMYMRLAFSIAIHIEPDIVLVDEVLAVGDQSFQLRCLDKIHEMKRKGVTIILVTHDLASVRKLCDRAIWLDDAQVREEGEVERVLRRYVDQVYSQDTEQLLEAERETETQAQEEADQEDDESSWRWGSREAEFVQVQLLNEKGQETRSFRTGETFIARMHYQAHERIEEPLFGVALHSASGYHISGPNTGFASYDIPYIKGPGHIDYIVPDLALLEGTYTLSVALYDKEGAHAFDHHHKAYTFRVAASHKIKEQYGAFFMPSRWHLVNGNGAPDDEQGQSSDSL